MIILWVNIRVRSPPSWNLTPFSGPRDSDFPASSLYFYFFKRLWQLFMLSGALDLALGESEWPVSSKHCESNGHFHLSKNIPVRMTKFLENIASHSNWLSNHCQPLLFFISLWLKDWQFWHTWCGHYHDYMVDIFNVRMIWKKYIMLFDWSIWHEYSCQTNIAARQNLQ